MDIWWSTIQLSKKIEFIIQIYHKTEKTEQYQIICGLFLKYLHTLFTTF